MGWYLSYGKNLLVHSGSDVTGAVYRRVLEEHLVSHDRAWHRNNLLLADDNARPHRACVVDAYPMNKTSYAWIGPPIVRI